MKRLLSISAMAERCGLTPHTLRYYERAGLLRPVNRGRNGHRQFDAGDIAWVEILIRLRATGMPIAEMRRYADLRAEGEGTVTARRELLENHRRGAIEDIERKRRHLDALEQKIETYRAIEAETGGSSDDERTL